MQFTFPRKFCSNLVFTNTFNKYSFYSTKGPIMQKRTQPKWNPHITEPESILPDLWLFNSLTSKKERFIPQEGSIVKWYTCGPTVYDVSHMGHARTYIAFDFMRRIFMDYFGFHVKYVLNITDIDDKIIKRARQNYLMDDYLAKDLDLVAVITDISKAIKKLKEKSDTDPDPDKKAFLKSEAERLISLLTHNPDGEDSVAYLIRNARDAIAEVVDETYGYSVTEHSIFESLARRFENEYHVDMRALNILPPDILVRVTDYIEPIIKYVQKIIDNGFAYVSSTGSVYFDTNRFANSNSHFYAKLIPTAYGDTEQLATGEGELTTSGEKRSNNDFALWKSSKPGEPAWSSPWGQGRPGWHIECSAMASGIFGHTLDIHGGGVDLKFPHHDNELAQSEAYFGHSHWVNYFLHSGHLTISGCKMSKSLKNFITIREALKQNSSRLIRLTFLLHSWRDTMDYSADTLAEAINFEKQIIDFLYNSTNVQYLAKYFISTAERKINNNSNLLLPDQFDLMPILNKVQQDVYDALCDSCDTRLALEAIRELINQADLRIFSHIESNSYLLPMADQVYLAARFILRLLRIFGVAENTFVSQGSPVPVGALVVGKKMTDEYSSYPHMMLDEFAFEQRSWLSLDTITDKELSSVLYTVLNATSLFVNSLLSEGPLLQDMARQFIVQLQSQFKIDLFDLPETGHNCLELLIGNVTSQKLDKLMKIPFGLEIKIWPQILNCFHFLISIRQSVRQCLASNQIHDSACKQRLYKACDRFRDQDLLNAGIRLQDRATVNEIIKGSNNLPFIGLMDKKILLNEMNNKIQRDTQRKEIKAVKQLARDEIGCLSPSDMFRNQLDKYSQFDEQGIPTHDASGKELTKSAIKKLQKLYNIQAKKHTNYLSCKLNEK